MTSRTSLRPTRALLHPLWLGALAVLVLNDHVLKGASVLPPALTGKLSDFAGLVVAPLLLAALLRVRSDRGWLASHVAVGLGFCAIQLSATAAELWSAAMGSIGFPWHITRDVTDLVALPALALSLLVLRTAMTRPVAAPARRSAEAAAAGAGLLCCAATSPPPSPPPTEPFTPDLNTDVYVHNAGETPLVVRMRSLTDSIDVECSAVASDPGRLLTDPLFGQSRSFLLEPDQNFGLRPDGWEWDWSDEGVEGEYTGDCHAYLLDVDGLPPAVVFWERGSVPTHWVPGTGYEGGSPRGGIDLVPSADPDHLGSYEAMGDEIVHVVPESAPPVAGACAPQSDAGRIEWSEPMPVGTYELLEIERGADGCFALDLGSRDIDGQVIDQDRWYLCVPLSDLGLVPGRRVRLRPTVNGTNDVGGVLLSTDDDPVEGEPLVELTAYRGEVFPQTRDINVAAVPEFDCDYVVGDSCGTVTRATAVTAGGGEFGVTELLPGEAQTLEGDLGSMTIAVAHSEERAALDPECAEGPDTLGLDLEVVTLYIEPNAG